MIRSALACYLADLQTDRWVIGVPPGPRQVLDPYSTPLCLDHRGRLKNTTAVALQRSTCKVPTAQTNVMQHFKSLMINLQISQINTSFMSYNNKMNKILYLK